ncbi:urease accessory protein UreE [Pararhodonellum marinum]|uniref:urease accessory protein UreE n=1 Tax=Pararhodonellum marinum TaxID=2755358 RepID=UPI00188EC9CE|nr:urease accessory protein UreE [Pararhodonellum marinum]
MILVQKILGNTKDIDVSGKRLDFLDLEWFEAGRTIIRKHTRNGVEVGIKKDLNPLEEGDVIYLNEETVILISIRPTLCIVFRPRTIREMAVVCYEIGNKHIPIYINEESEVIVAFEHPLYHLLERFGYKPKREERKILKTSQLGSVNHLVKSYQPITFKN